MRIVNKTHWQTAPIRAIVSHVAAVELAAEARKRLVVTIKYRRRSRSGGALCLGHAYSGRKGLWVGRDMTITVPSLEVDPVSLAKVAAHEMAHLRGLGHAEMKGPNYSYAHPGWRAYYAWAQGFPISRAREIPKPTRDQNRQAKLNHARAKVVTWERTAKRAVTKLKTWRRRVRTLERTILKAAQPPAPPDPQV